MNYWLFKSEPDEFSIDDLKSSTTTPWEGVRNYQARNFMRDECKKGDLILFYHSSCKNIGVAGVATVSKEAFPDKAQFDENSPYYDPKSSEEKPRWFCCEVKFKSKFNKVVPLKDIKENAKLKDMHLVKKGSRLSIQPVKKDEFEEVLNMSRTI
ncbi:MAG: EVE domain-containing protein [Halobacteriovoraceae bacterium]|nr:EVE domain-containing protein [Halobacteriovoraceae bacterium]|tara:strand:- start:9170 stop:9631 length:462 start_codon:yes stop_codon:yes gene_type:complete